MNNTFMKKIIKVLIICLLLTICGCDANSSLVQINSKLDEELIKNNCNGENFICSPLSIKSMLKILEDSSNGESKKQISSQISGFNYPLITNDDRISIFNGLFLKDSYSENVKNTYLDMIRNNYGCELVIDSFNTPDNINNWISEHTFNLINNAFDDVSDNDFLISNTLSIDLDWINTLQNDYHFRPAHIAGWPEISIYDYNYAGPHTDNFDNDSQYIRTYLFGCAANKYDLFGNIGEDSIRETVYPEYIEWYKNAEKSAEEYGYVDNFHETTLPPDQYIDSFVDDIKNGEGQFGYFGISTDFSYYTDDDVKVFSKELKEHNGFSLQYLAIMPKQSDLSTYIQSFDIDCLNRYLLNLKAPTYDNLEDGYITLIHGSMPEFDFESSLDLKEFLPTIGVTDIFDPSKADLSKMSDGNPFITSFSNKTNICLNNEGIKASSITAAGGLGAGGDDFDHLYEVPIIDIDLTFDNPFVFFIIDKNTNEVWFEGTVFYPNDTSLGY